MPETIIKDYCPKCGRMNLLNMGDMEDLTAFEPDGIECHACGHEWLLGGNDNHPDMDEYCFEKGEKSISD